MIDLRSDTVTRPSAAMLEAMVSAAVGDDVYGEDPTVRELEARTAELLGHEAGLFCPTGSMANLLGVWLHVPVGSEVLCDSVAHVARAEMGAHGALHGVTMRTWTSERGRVVADDVLAMLAIDCGPYLVETACVAVEDTSNFGGGTVQDFGEVSRLSAELARVGVRRHLDGARLANAAAATGRRLAEYGALFDTVSICLSKGLGAPVGSVLVGSSADVAGARVQRKRLGGGWRQAGVLAAAGLWALEHNLPRIGEDHAAARAFADAVATRAPHAVDVDSVETNIVLLRAPGARTVAAACEERGVRLSVLGPESLRAVTHLDVSLEDCAEAGRVVGELLSPR
ncbi:low specificity L-threonine aldolase [Tessaracoccus rhinocerotis]|uniref:Low specificity L-threonine aldolase n=1 Tax=Tessaracoccus rhinocerotis TaxID=1689449 RepID=A0A553K2E3_9ACTN|nr:GntG family PLP-dependent aldolase [Tessaracoccus rhinocerotis]TRY18858.1 low specificity L-threonine aldolase [Tessaracoccus rhinocerotis]